MGSLCTGFYLFPQPRLAEIEPALIPRTMSFRDEPSSPTTAAPNLKGDVEEVRARLSDPALDGDPATKRTVLQCVIALMTMGVDTSSLFTSVIRACFTPDLVSKKLIYFYLTTQSKTNRGLAILSINTFLKECGDESPLVRGLALRSLAALKGIAQLYEYLFPVLKVAFSDRSAYVRKIATLCALLVFRASPEDYIANGFHDAVLMCLKDPSAQVCANALEVLLEIAAFDCAWEEQRQQQELDCLDASTGTGTGAGKALPSAGAAARHYHPAQHTPFNVTKPVIYHLLSSLGGLNEWQQAQIINLVRRYTPAGEEEMFDIMNVLEERLTGMHGGLVLSCAHAFIHVTQNYPAVHAQVLQRLRQPLLMLLTCSASTESSYAVLCHLKLLVRRGPAVYRGDYKAFFCRYGEPSYMRAMKLDVLAAVADAQSAAPIVEELVAVSEDRSAIIARKAIEALGRIALRLPDAAPHILSKFLELIDLGTVPVRGRTLVVLKDFLRKYRNPAVVRPFLAALVEAQGRVHFADQDSRTALVWVLGEFGEHLDDAPYILETMADDLLAQPATFRLQLLTSAVLLFFKRPPEMQALLGRVFGVLVNDFSNADVLDRAMMYYRLLREDPAAAAHIICTPKEPLDGAFFEDQDTDSVDKLFFEEFDSLSVVYGMTADRYTASSDYLAGSSDDDDDEEEDEGAGEGEEEEYASGGSSSPHQQAGLLDNRQGIDDDGLGRLLETAPSNDTSTALPTVALVLSDDAEVEPAQFQQQWAALPTVYSGAVRMAATASSATAALVEFLEGHCVFTLASGVQGDAVKLYLFSEERATVDELFGAAPGELFLAEVIAVAAGGTAQVTVKSRSANGPRYATLLQGLLTSFRP